MAKIDKPLKYDANKIIGEFDLKRHVNSNNINQLTTKQCVLENESINSLEKHRLDLELFGNYWDDAALKMNFIAHILKYANFYQENVIDTFHKRPLSWRSKNKKDTILCDSFLAKPFGVYAPQAPYYFFLQEFKKQKKNEDAEGQMLLAMLIAQQENNNGKSIYGCYLQGKFWVFTTLHDKNYCVSRAYDATQKADLHKIIFMLRALKHVILTELS